MASCTSPALVDTRQVKIPDFSSICLDSGKKKQVHTPSTVCPTPRTPVSPALLPPLALDLHEQTSSSEDVQPFWWPMSEGDEGVLSSPFDEPQEGKQVVNLSQISRSQNSKAFGCLGLPDWVYGPRGARDPEWDDDSTCSDDSDGPSCQTSSDSPVESCFESRMPVAIRPKSAKASWADLAEELENAQMVQPKPPTAKPKVNWADLQEASDDDLPSWKWN
ncbi:unnamed protein product [Durusdinium trenchii]|uniref:Chloroplastic n=2 Tax=Durusdinium trenchii TaxID=1381693 RepID=A0ABP0SDK2_9DINO